MHMAGPTHVEVHSQVDVTVTYKMFQIEIALLLVIVMLNFELYWRNYDGLKFGCSIISYIWFYG